MDTFKLLARSTNIQKSWSSVKKDNEPHIPSAGVPNQPPRFPDNGNTPYSQEGQNYQGTKRKRGGLESDFRGGITGILDFFGDRSKLAPQTEESEPKEEGAETQETKNIEDKAPELSEEKCRQILKEHNIKITVLGETHRVQDGRKHLHGKSEPENRNQKKDMRAQIFPQPLTSFKQLRSKYGLSRRLAANLEAQGYKEPTEVQLGSLPILLGSDEERGLGTIGLRKKSSRKHPRAEVDLLTIAPTGSGKTLAFMIHLLQELMKERQARGNTSEEEQLAHQVRALIIAPTHELADQIVNEGRKLAWATGIKISGLKKGTRLHPEFVDKNEQANGEDSGDEQTWKQKFLVKSDILVSTPLLLLHAISAIESAVMSLPDVGFIVLDEADILLDPLFREQTLAIWTACCHPSLRTSLWSATIGSSIETLAQSFIRDRRRNFDLSLSSRDPPHHILRLVVGLKDSAIPNISHRLIYAASEQGKLLALRQLLHPSATSTTEVSSLQPPFLIFTQTIPRAIALHSELLYDIPIEAGGSSRIAVLHSDLSHSTRSKIMAGFRKGEIWVLITTDLLSRGVDFRGINGVVNYDIPNTSASYIHRVGRTGRQGREGGVAVTLYTKEDIPYVKNVANVIAASERAKGNTKGGEKGVQKWLLDALPDVSKKTKKDLKRRGVQSRRPTVEKEGGREPRKTRISTKSGYARRLENKKKGAVDGSRRRVAQAEGDAGGRDDEEWGGIQD